MPSRCSRHSAYAITSPLKEPRVIGRWSIRMPSASKERIWGALKNDAQGLASPRILHRLPYASSLGKQGNPGPEAEPPSSSRIAPASRRSTRSAQTTVANTAKN